MLKMKMPKDRTTAPPSQLCNIAHRRHMKGMEYALAHCSLRDPHRPCANSRIARIDNHNAWLGVKLLFKRLPALEAWLKEAYNDKFVTRVGPDFSKVLTWLKLPSPPTDG